MPNPIGSEAASATTVTQFRKDLTDVFNELFENHYHTDTPSWKQQLFKVVQMDGAYLVAHTHMNAPLFYPRIDGAEAQESGIDGLTYTLYPYDYETPKMVWGVNALQDTKNNFRSRVDEAAMYLARFRDFAQEELQAGAATTFLHGEVDFTTIFGSTGLFSASHTYNGVTLNNIVTGTGTASANIFDDVYSARRAFMDMNDANSRPYWDEIRLRAAQMTVVIPSALDQAFDGVIASTTYVTPGGTSPADNFLKTVYGDKLNVVHDAALTDADNYFFYRTSDVGNMRPYVYGDRLAIQPILWTMEDSDESKKTHNEAAQWWMRAAVGIGDPVTAVTVQN
jgi:hypothetical protein